jgi:hypothetical protein
MELSEAIAELEYLCSRLGMQPGEWVAYLDPPNEE